MRNRASWRPSRLAHLVTRFFGALTARPLSNAEAAEVRGLLPRNEQAIFFSQPVMDQRHGLTSARLVLQRAAGRNDLARAALLHDVGKRHSGFGVMGRSAATALDLLRLPLRGRVLEYLEHGPIGATDLEGIGSVGVVVEFARHHAGDRPSSIPAADWKVLHEADLGA